MKIAKFECSMFINVDPKMKIVFIYFDFKSLIIKPVPEKL